jgi:hypothetical protein
MCPSRVATVPQLFLEALHARKYEVLRRLVGAGIMDEPAFAIEVLPVLLARTERLPAYLYVHPSSNRLPAAAVTAGVTAVVGSSAGSGTGRGAETTDMFASLEVSTAEEAGTLMRGLGAAHGAVFRMPHSPWTLFVLDEKSRAIAEEMASR